MKNQNTKNIIKILLVVILVTLVVIYRFIPKQTKNINTKFLILHTYVNYAWGTQFNGKAIYEDGSIYTWDDIDDILLKKYEIETPNGIKDFIKNEATLSKTKIDKKDLLKIKESVSILKDTIKFSSIGAVQGTTTISVINENNNEIILKQTGDRVGENKSKEAQRILKILEKYDKK